MFTFNKKLFQCMNKYYRLDITSRTACYPPTTSKIATNSCEKSMHVNVAWPYLARGVRIRVHFKMRLYYVITPALKEVWSRKGSRLRRIQEANLKILST